MRTPTETRLEKSMRSAMRYFRWVLLAAVGILICTGIFRVESDEVAIILRMGHLVGRTLEDQILQPGLHFAFPYVIDEVIKVPVGKVKELAVSTHNSTGSTIGRNVNNSGYLITGDNNIVLVQAVTKYRIDDPVAYVLACGDPEKMVESIVSGDLLKYTSKLDVDSMLTTGKGALAESVRHSSQTLLDAVNCGITLTNIELTSITPPEEVRRDFEAVNTASVRKSTYIQEAREYRESVIPDAQAQAQQYIDTARANQQTLTARAQSDTAVFNGLVEQYHKSPLSVMEGYMKQRIASIIAKMSVFVLDDADQTPRIILP